MREAQRALSGNDHVRGLELRYWLQELFFWVLLAVFGVLYLFFGSFAAILQFSLGGGVGFEDSFW